MVATTNTISAALNKAISMLSMTTTRCTSQLFDLFSVRVWGSDPGPLWP